MYFLIQLFDRKTCYINISFILVVYGAWSLDTLVNDSNHVRVVRGFCLFERIGASCGAFDTAHTDMHVARSWDARSSV